MTAYNEKLREASGTAGFEDHSEGKSVDDTSRRRSWRSTPRDR